MNHDIRPAPLTHVAAAVVLLAICSAAILALLPPVAQLVIAPIVVLPVAAAFGRNKRLRGSAGPRRRIPPRLFVLVTAAVTIIVAVPPAVLGLGPGWIVAAAAVLIAGIEVLHRLAPPA